MLSKGSRFGRLVVVEDRGWNNVLLLCDCGREHVSIRNNIRRGRVQSCGCLKRQRLQEKHNKRWHAGLPSIGSRFGRLVVIRHERPHIVCKCDCGTTGVRTLKWPLLYGHKSSCGCLWRETARERGHKNRKHGGYGTPLWKRWCGIRQRCNNSKDTSYHLYGARGIRVCDRWQGEQGFENFRADVGEPPTLQHSLDRIDSNGDYEPNNVR